MTRGADTDMTCSRGKAGTVGYAAIACCFLQDLFLNVCKNGQAIIRSAISPYRSSLTFDAWPGSEWQSRNLRLTPGRPPNVVQPLGRERSLQPSSSLHSVSGVHDMPCCTLARRGGPVDTSNGIIHKIGLLCCIHDPVWRSPQRLHALATF